MLIYKLIFLTIQIKKVKLARHLNCWRICHAKCIGISRINNALSQKQSGVSNTEAVGNYNKFFIFKTR